MVCDNAKCEWHVPDTHPGSETAVAWLPSEDWHLVDRQRYRYADGTVRMFCVRCDGAIQAAVGCVRAP